MEEQIKTIDEKGAADVVAVLAETAQLVAMTPLTGGVSANTYMLETSQADGASVRWVLREHGASHSGHSAKTEFALLKALHQQGFRVPEPLLCDVSHRLSAYDFIVMSYIEGGSNIPVESLDHCIAAMAEELWNIHCLPVEVLPNLPPRLNPVPEVFDYLPIGSEWSQLHARLRTLKDTGYQGRPCLLHGDYWPQNLLWQDGQIGGILDWEDAAIGDPLSDVAQASVELRYLFGPEGMQKFITAYSAHAAVDPQRLALWQIYVAAAAQHFMSDWGLEKSRENHMRRVALESIRNASAILHLDQ